MAAIYGLACLILVVFQIEEIRSFEESHAEELFVKRLATGHLYTYSQFSTVSDIFAGERGSHYKLFPKSFGQIVKKYDVAELHLSLTHGRWRHALWGHPITAAPYGVELWVWFSPSLEDQRIDKQWSGLVNALSGQFCASLNYLQKSVSSSPSYSFRPMGLWHKDLQNGSKYLRYAVLPREVVCTENLTPWKKLLPCESKAGIATLFNALHLYEASFHSLAIHLRSVCNNENCSSTATELKQSLSSVNDPSISGIKEGWSFSRIFGEILKSSCPLAQTSKVIIALPQENDGYELKLIPKPTMQESKFVAGKVFQYATYDLKKIDLESGFNLHGSYLNISDGGTKQPSVVHVHRYTTGYGEEGGGVVSLISNEHASKVIRVVYFDMIPWYIPVYLHTLEVEHSGTTVKPDLVKFIPAKDRSRPTSIEMVLSLPPKSTLKLTYSFARAFLKWTEHPPDSHHGYYIGSAVISTQLPDAHNLTGISERCSSISGKCIGHSPLFIRIHTESNLVVLPTPDFSMPYNVICLTCTIFAIGFGSMLNLATRNFVVSSNKKKLTLKDRLNMLFVRLFKAKTS